MNDFVGSFFNFNYLQYKCVIVTVIKYLTALGALVF